MKNRRKRKNTKNRVMSIRVLLTRDLYAPIYRHKTDDPIDPEELFITGQDPQRVNHLRSITHYTTEQMGVNVKSENIIRERGFCIHKACRCCPAIKIHCKSMIDWGGSVIQRKRNKNPMQRIIEIQSPIDITPEWYRQTIACHTFRKLKVLTKDQTIRLVSSIVAITLPYYALPEDVAKDKTLGKSLTAARVEWSGDKRWVSEYDLFLLENFAVGIV